MTTPEGRPPLLRARIHGLVTALTITAVLAPLLAVPLVPGGGSSSTDSDTEDGVTITTSELTLAPGPGRATIDFGLEGSSVAFRWDDPELRFRFRRAGHTDWMVVASEHHGHDDATAGTVTPHDEGLETPHGEDGVPVDEQALDPVWTGDGTRSIEVDVLAGDGSDLEASLFTVAPGPMAFRSAARAATPGGLQIRPTSAWNSPGWSYDNCPQGRTHMDRVDFAVVHHTATGNSYSSGQVDEQLRSIHAFHVRTRGWCDIAYNFMIDRFGRVWQARSGDIFGAVQGGHAAGFNQGSVGIALLGDYGTTAPTTEMLTRAGDLAGWKLAAWGRQPDGTTQEVSGGTAKWPAGQHVTLDRVTYHRAVQSTSCPGAAVMRRTGTIVDAANRFRPRSFTYGRLGDLPLIGDWDGDGQETPVVRRNNQWYVRNSLTTGVADFDFSYGKPDDSPVAGDWDGDGVDTLGVFRDGRFYLRNSNTKGVADLYFDLGRPGDRPVAGDFDGDGRDEVGVHRGNEVLLWDSDQVTGRDPAAPKWHYGYGRAGDRAFVGDWDLDGRETVSVQRGNHVHLKNSLAGGGADYQHLVEAGQYALFSHGRLGLSIPTVSDGRHWKAGAAPVPA